MSLSKGVKAQRLAAILHSHGSVHLALKGRNLPARRYSPSQTRKPANPQTRKRPSPTPRPSQTRKRPALSSLTPSSLSTSTFFLPSPIIIAPGRKPKQYLRELWRYRDLIGLFVKRDFTAKYKQTLLGPLWHFIQPAMTTAVSVVLFNLVAKIGTNGANMVLFQMAGIVIWTYFSACFVSTSGTFIANAGIFGKVYFPRLATPISVIISQLVQFGIQFLLLLCTMAFFALRGEAVAVHWGWLLLPYLVLLMACMGLGLGIIISSVTTKYRDLTVMISFGVQLVMYVSAVNYPIAALADTPRLAAIVQYNPLAAMVELFRNTVLHLPVANLGFTLAYSTAWAIGLLVLGVRVFSRVERTFMDTV
ncbi:MAG: ABC transporter permease [Bacteroidetes bacterium]|nr:MAG: ABC transporter permease [Bacteroidota bacterium]